MGGKGSGCFSKIKTWQLIQAYEKYHSVRKVGKIFGISGSAVHERLSKHEGLIVPRTEGDKRYKVTKKRMTYLGDPFNH